MILPECPVKPPPPILYVGCTTQPLATRLNSRGHRGVRAGLRPDAAGVVCVGKCRPGDLRAVKTWEAHYARVLAPRVDGENRPRGARLTPSDIPLWSWHGLREVLRSNAFSEPPYLYVIA